MTKDQHLDDAPGHEGAVGHHATDDHGEDHGHDDHAHAEEPLGPIDVWAWGAGALGILPVWPSRSRSSSRRGRRSRAERAAAGRAGRRTPDAERQTKIGRDPTSKRLAAPRPIERRSRVVDDDPLGHSAGGRRTPSMM